MIKHQVSFHVQDDLGMRTALHKFAIYSDEDLIEIELLELGIFNLEITIESSEEISDVDFEKLLA